MKTICLILGALPAGSMLALASPAAAQQAGDAYVRVAAARTKLVDNGEVATNGVVNPADGYKTRDAYHGVLTGGFFMWNGVAVEASISTPATTNNVPAGGLAGLPNLGDDEFTTVTVGANIQPFKGRVSPFVGAGIVRHFTTQERDGLGVGLNIPNAHGPYVQAGVDYALTPRWGVFASVRKAWYDTNATGRLPLDATMTSFAAVSAKAELDPVTIQLGVTARFGRHADDGALEPIGTDTTKWTVRAGLTSLTLADRVDLSVGGAHYPGADLSTFEHWTPTVQIGRFLTRNVAINLTAGIPPSIDVYGGGSIGSLPKLGKVRYGPMALTAQYHFTRSGRIRPYVGAGASYMIVFGTKDGTFENLKVKDDFGWAFEAGTDIMISNRVAIFGDVKKALLRPVTTGLFMGDSVVGKTRLDPWAFSGGIAYHF
ncbi:OmpW family outer membrane protein [uncultured Sphingomonas sp.]|uniref:OmpW/AlkL family protein n=1 Tax=uncultured Sphingomonas sp. TaxID=158754 RepID=UPI0025D85E6A|nr:OmpW family outer membrane protein [uncultured Sphingomonas sp.]